MVNKKIIKDIVKKCIDSSRDFLKGFVDGHLRIPTYTRKLSEDETSVAYKTGGFLPFMGIPFFLVYPILGYYYLFNHNKTIAWTTLVTQVGSNIASGLYEWYKYEKDKSKEKTPLEKKVEQPEIKIPPVKTSFINPWEVKVPEYKKEDEKLNNQLVLMGERKW